MLSKIATAAGLLTALLLTACTPPVKPPPSAAAQPAPMVERLEITDRSPAFGGMAFGRAGAYERIRAVAHLRIDPAAPQNRGIADLDKAPRGADGWVHYSTQVLILRPQDPQRARRVLLYDVVNRGMPLLLGFADDAPTTDFSSAAQAGNGFLLRQGFTLVWSGWQARADGPDTLRAALPVATDDGAPITGRVERRLVFDNLTNPGLIPLPYPAATPDKSAAQLDVREYPQDPPQPIAATEWQYVNATTVRVNRPADVDAGGIYTFDYTARDPVVAGLGFAATRDLVAFLRRTDADLAGNPNPLADLRRAPCEMRDAAGGCRRPDAFVELALGTGFSQSGRYLRDFLWQGFNNDGGGRRVFDGVLPFIAGARKTYTNVRWAQPGRFSLQHEDHGVYGDQFPFSYAVITDPVSGAGDGILKRCNADDTCPKIFHVDTSAEFWQAGSALVGTDGAGHDIALPDNVRAYLVAGANHYPTLRTPYCQNPGNPLNYSPLVRALIVAMTDWSAGRAAPPASVWPRLARHELAPPADRGAVGFPDLSALRVNYTGVVNTFAVTDYDRVPPQSDTGRQWQVLVPKTDADGNDAPGVHLPPVAAPRATLLGWNLRRRGYAEGDLCFLFGSRIPFAADQRARTRSGDPRPSLEERYGGAEDYVQAVKAAAEYLAQQKLLLPEDVQGYVNRAVQQQLP